MATAAKIRANAKYDAANTQSMSLKFNLKTDADILEALEIGAAEYGGKQGYIKALIRADIERRAAK